MELNRHFFSSINYQNLLNTTESSADSLASENIEFRDQCIRDFDDRLNNLVCQFSSPNHHLFPQPVHLGWEEVTEKIYTAKSKHGNVILALFHFGKHRDIIVDLACNGIPIAAPIAGKAYWDFYEQRDIAPVEFAECFNLIEVDNPSVGKQLIKHLKSNRFITIYADGNMGPDGAHVVEGGINIDFFDKSFAVKEGIARLARAFNFPVLPLFSILDTENNDHFKIEAGELVHAENNVMQVIYKQLENKIHKRPQHWEFITCAHRWINAQENPTTKPTTKEDSLSEVKSFKIDTKFVRIAQINNKTHLINLKTQKSYIIPSWAMDVISSLQQGCSASSLNQWIESNINNQPSKKFINELIEKELVVSYM
jgi:hypothetical protein